MSVIELKPSDLGKQERKHEESWRTRLCALAGVFQKPGVNTSEMAELVTAVLGLGFSRLPALGRTAWIDAQGRIRANHVAADGSKTKNRPLMSVQQYHDIIRRLGDMVCREDWEYQELYSEFRKWIARDMRVAKQQAETIRDANREYFGSGKGRPKGGNTRVGFEG